MKLFIYLHTSFSGHRPAQREYARTRLRSHARCHPYPIPQPVKVGHTTGVYDPYLFSNSDVGSFTSHKNKSVKVINVARNIDRSTQKTWKVSFQVFKFESEKNELKLLNNMLRKKYSEIHNKCSFKMEYSFSGNCLQFPNMGLKVIH